MGTILTVCLFYICFKVHKIDKALNRKNGTGLITRLVSRLNNSDSKEETTE